MKKLFLILFIWVFAVIGGYAKKDKSKSCSVCGAWKYANSSAINDFQRFSSDVTKNEHTTEYIVFSENNQFRHEFVNEKGMVFKTLTGKWKIVEDKFKIQYADIDFQLSLNYFFLDKDLVLGQNFNHIIFSKDNLDEIKLALK